MNFQIAIVSKPDIYALLIILMKNFSYVWDHNPCPVKIISPGDCDSIKDGRYTFKVITSWIVEMVKSIKD